MRLKFEVYSTVNWQKDLIAEAKKSQQDTQKALRASGKVLERAIRLVTPNSTTSGRSWNSNRKKYGVLRKAVGMYDTKTRRLKPTETAGVNVGYLKSKQLKYFVARFLNDGAYNVKSQQFERYYSDFIRRTEKMTDPLVKEVFYKTIEMLIAQRLDKFAKKWTKF